MEKLCPDCTVIYQNANADAAQQQQQFNSVITQGAKVIVLDPVDSSAAASLVQLAQSQDVKVIAYDRPIPDVPADYYVSFDNEAIGRSEEHTSELQSLMRISYAVFCLKKKK